MHIKAKKSTTTEVTNDIAISLTNCTDAELLDKLRTFNDTEWAFSEGDIHQWIAVLNRFDDVLADSLKPVHFVAPNETVVAVPIPKDSFPRDLVIAVVQFTTKILGNCSNKYLYNSVERLVPLLRFPDSELVVCGLQALTTLVSRHRTRITTQITADPTFGSMLFQLAQGWGGREDGLGLLYCCSNSDVTSKLSTGASLNFEFYTDEADIASKKTELEKILEKNKTSQETTTTNETQPSGITSVSPQADSEKEKRAKESEEKKERERQKASRRLALGFPHPGQTAIHIPNMHRFEESDLTVLEELVTKYRVPDDLHFSLLQRIRVARSFPSVDQRRNMLRIQLLAFTVLAQAQVDANLLNTFFLQQPEYISELVELVRTETSGIPTEFRTLAINALHATIMDRTSLPKLIAATGSAQHHGDIPSMINKSVATLTSSIQHPVFTIAFVEALFSFVSSLVATPEGAAALSTSGMIGSLLPLLRHPDSNHIPIVLQYLNMLESFVSNNASSSNVRALFRDLGGLEALIDRFNQEIARIENRPKQTEEAMLLEPDEKDKGKQKVASAPTSAAPGTQLPSTTISFLSTLLRVFALFSDGGRRSATRLTGLTEGPFPVSLCHVLKHYDMFGETLFSLALTITSRILNNDPTRFPQLKETTLPDQIIEFIKTDIPVSSMIITTIPAVLSSICLHEKGLALVKDSQVVDTLLSLFIRKKYATVLRKGDTASVLGSGMDELSRHHTTLRPLAVNAVVNILKEVCSIGGIDWEAEEKLEEQKKQKKGKQRSSTKKDEKQEETVESEEGGQMQTEKQTASTEELAKEDKDQSALPSYIDNIGRFLEQFLANNEHGRLFINSKGLEHLLRLFRLPSLSPSFPSSQAAHYLTVSLRALSANHSARLVRSVLNSMHLQFVALDALHPTWREGSGFIQEHDDPQLIAALRSMDCYASVLSDLVRDPNGLSHSPFASLSEWTTGNGIAVCLAMGQLQRCILWEIASVSYGERQKEKEASAMELESGSSEGGTSSTLVATEEEEEEAAETETGDSDAAAQGQSTSAEDEAAKRAKKEKHKTKAVSIHLISSIHSLSQSLAKVLALPSRRSEDKIVLGIVQTLAKILLDHIVWTPKGFEEDEHQAVVKSAYLGSVIGELRSLLFHEQKQVTHTLLLHAFKHVDALPHFLKAFEWTTAKYMDLRKQELAEEALQIKGNEGKGKDKAELEATSSKPSTTNPAGEEKVKVEMKIVKAALLTFGTFIKYLTSGHMLLGSDVTEDMLTRNLPGEKGPFDPHTFLRSIHEQVLVSILPLWNNEFFPHFPSRFIGNVLSGINSILSFEELGTAPQAPAAAAKKPSFQPDPQAVMSLTEMGFPAAHAEEALRQIGSNSVELATEWLFANPPPTEAASPSEDTSAMEEDDELAAALAMSLGQEMGSPQQTSKAEEEQEKAEEIDIKEQYKKLRRDMLTRCLDLIAKADTTLSFTISSVLGSSCKKDEERNEVISGLLTHIKAAQGDPTPSVDAMYQLTHVLTLMLVEYPLTRQKVAESGVVASFLEMLRGAVEVKKREEDSKENSTEPKWLSPVLLAVDALCHTPTSIIYKELTPEEEQKKETSSTATMELDEQAKKAKEEEALERELRVTPTEVPTFLSVEDRTNAIEVCVRLLQIAKTQETTQAVLQLCSRLTREYDLALRFLKLGGLPLLISLPTNIQFQGRTALIETILRHLLEEPSLLQSAMENEIKSTFNNMATQMGRTPSTALIKPKNFLQAVAPLVCRELDVFLRASKAVLRLKDPKPGVPLNRVALVLAEPSTPSTKSTTSTTTMELATSTTTPTAATTPTTPRGTPRKGTDPAKPKKRTPNSLVQVVTELINALFVVSSPKEEKEVNEPALDAAESISKGKDASMDVVVEQENKPTLTSTEIIRFLTNFITAYPPCCNVIMRYGCTPKHKPTNKGKGKAKGKNKGKEKETEEKDTSLLAEGYDANKPTFIGHILTHLLSQEIKSQLPTLADESIANHQRFNASGCSILLSLTQRPEGKRRIVSELLGALKTEVEKFKSNAAADHHSYPYTIHALVEFLYVLLTSTAARNPSTGFLAEISKLLMEGNIIKLLTSSLRMVNLNHPHAPKLVNAVIRPLEILTRITAVLPPKFTTAANSSQQTTAAHAEPSQTTPAPEIGQPVAAEGAVTEEEDTRTEGRSAAEDMMHQMMHRFHEAAAGGEEEDQLGGGAPPSLASIMQLAMGFVQEGIPPGGGLGEEDDVSEEEDEEEHHHEDSEDEDQEGGEVEGDMEGDAEDDESVEEDEDEEEYDEDEGEDEGDGWYDFDEGEGQEPAFGGMEIQLEAADGEGTVASWSLPVEDILGGSIPPRPGRVLGGRSRVPATRFNFNALSTGETASETVRHPLLQMIAGGAIQDVFAEGLSSLLNPALRGSPMEDEVRRLLRRATLRGSGRSAGRRTRQMAEESETANMREFAESCERLLVESLRPVTMREHLAKENAQKAEKEKAAAAAAAQKVEKAAEKEEKGESSTQEGTAESSSSMASEQTPQSEPSSTTSQATAEQELGNAAEASATTGQEGAASTEPQGSTAEQTQTAERPTFTTEEAGTDAGEAPQSASTEESLRAESSAPETSIQAPAAPPSATAVTEEIPGIDPAFLAALPEELRAEVLATHISQASSSNYWGMLGSAQQSTSSSTPTLSTTSSSGSPGQPAESSTPSTTSNQIPQESSSTSSSTSSPPSSSPASSGTTLPASSPVSSSTVPTGDTSSSSASSSAPSSSFLSSAGSSSSQGSSTGVSSGVSTSTISPDFIAALPPDIQMEVLQQEQQRLLQERMARQTDTSRAEAMSTADFLATLSPDLRADILMSQDDSVLGQLPPEIVAEANALRERAYREYQNRGARRGGFWGRDRGRPTRVIGLSSAQRDDSSDSDSEEEEASPARRRAPMPFLDLKGKPVVEKEDLVALVRLLYLAKPLAKTLLHRLFLNLSANVETRTQLLHMFMTILDATSTRPSSTLLAGDSSAKSFKEALAQLPSRSASSDFSPLEEPTHSALSPGGISVFMHTGEHPPSIVSRRVLEILCHLAKNNPRIADFIIGADQKLAKLEGEGNQEAVMEFRQLEKAEWCPLVRLLSLLGISQFQKSTAQLSQLLQLLSLAIQPLVRRRAKEEKLRAEKKEKEEREQRQREERERQQKKQETASADASASTASSSTSDAQSSTMTATQEGTAQASTTPMETETAAAASSSEEATKVNEEERKEATKKELTLQELCPFIPPKELHCLVNVLALEHCNEQTAKHTTVILSNLAANKPNLEVLLKALTHAAQKMGEVVMENLRMLHSELEKSNHPSLILSTTSTVNEVNLLRIVKTIVSLPTLHSFDDGAVFKPSEDYLASLQLDPLWDALESCLDTLNEEAEREKSTGQGGKALTPPKKDKGKERAKDKDAKTSPTASLLLPIIEVFFVVNANEPAPVKRSPSSYNLAAIVEGGASTSPSLTSSTGGIRRSPSLLTLSSSSLSRSASIQNLTELQTRFVRFAENYRHLLNELVRQNPSLLHGSFKVLLKYPWALDFDNKRAYFRSQLQKLKERSYYGGCRLRVRRKRVFEDSYQQMRNRTPEELRGRLSVQFQNEEGVDAGGVSREWYETLAKEMFNANYALFIATAQDNSTFQPNRSSYINPDHLSYFKFVGRVIGKAIFDGQYLPCHFTRSFYKHMLGVSVRPDDMEAIDPEYYKNLKWILDNDITGVLDDLTFSTEIDDFGTMKVVELKDGGKSIRVTEDNKVEYVRLVTEMRMTTSIKSQIQAFLEGFHEVIPKQLISIFNEMELELLISGLPEIDVDDLKDNTVYTGFTENDQEIQWFWNAVRSFGEEEKAKLLQFVTGTSRVPIDGFKSLRGISGPQKFQIHKSYNKGSLPSAHTCFNQLDLPQYDTYERLKEALEFAIRETEGFGFV